MDRRNLYAFTCMLFVGLCAFLPKLVWAESNSAVKNRVAVKVCTLSAFFSNGSGEFYDADYVRRDHCDRLSQQIPEANVGSGDGAFKIVILNIGTERLVDIALEAPDFDIQHQSLASECGTLSPGQSCEVSVDYINLAYLELLVSDVCHSPGLVSKNAIVSARGAINNSVVKDSDVAMIRCTGDSYLEEEPAQQMAVTDHQ